MLTLLNDEEWSQWSDREIARRCRVAQSMVTNRRRSLISEIGEPSPSRTYTTKHGTTAKMKTGNIGQKKRANNPTGKNGRRPTKETALEIERLAADGHVAAQIAATRPCPSSSTRNTRPSAR